MQTVFGTQQDHIFMQAALQQAQKAYKKKEVPVGAVVVDATGMIIARGYNKVESQKTQTAHAELCALVKAAKKINDWRLNGCWLYVTLQPCSMCMGLIKLSRMQGIVYGAPSPLFGYHLDNQDGLPVYKIDTLIISGIGEEQAANILKKFFREKREGKI